MNSELPKEPFGLQKAIELMLQGHKVSLLSEPQKYFVFVDNYFHKVRPDGQSFGADMNYYSNDSFVIYKEPSVPQGTPEVVGVEEWLVMDLQHNLRVVVKTPDIEDYCKTYGLCKVVLLSKSRS